MHQSMSYQAVSGHSKTAAMKFAAKLVSGEVTLEQAHKMLMAPDANKLDLFEIAGLAQAIACFQCSI